MITLNVDNDISMKVFNNNQPDLDWRAFFIVPHITSGQKSARETSILYGGLSGLMQFDRKGVCETSYKFISSVIDPKELGFYEEINAFEPIDIALHYATSLIANPLENELSTIVLVDNKTDLLLEILKPKIEKTYADMIISVNHLSTDKRNLDRYQLECKNQYFTKVEEYFNSPSLFERIRRLSDKIPLYFGYDPLEISDNQLYKNQEMIMGVIRE
jgi:hypothetical protein